MLTGSGAVSSGVRSYRSAVMTSVLCRYQQHIQHIGDTSITSTGLSKTIAGGASDFGYMRDKPVVWYIIITGDSGARISIRILVMVSRLMTVTSR